MVAVDERGAHTWLTMHAVNHGGMRDRLRAAIAKRKQLKGLMEEEDLVYQAGAKLHATLKRLAEQAYHP